MVPGPRGQRLSAGAKELRGVGRRALEVARKAVAPASPFDPGSAQNVWRIAASDYGESAIVLPALAGLRSAAPGTRIAVVEMQPSRIARQAEQGDIDLALHTVDGSPSSLRRRVLFTERSALAGRAGHPRLGRRPTLAQLCARATGRAWGRERGGEEG